MAPLRTTSAIATALSIAVLSYFLCNKTRSEASSRKTHKTLAAKKARNGLVAAIGNTPLIRINSLSDATGCEILGKAEFLNPGGSVKDRVAVKIIEEALKSGALAQGGIITEGSAGSTAISLATVAPAFGCKCHVVIPDDAAIEKTVDQFLNIVLEIRVNEAILALSVINPQSGKLEWLGVCWGMHIYPSDVGKNIFKVVSSTRLGRLSPYISSMILQSQILEALGATVERVRPVSITHKDHYVNIARRRATEANQVALKHGKGNQNEYPDVKQINGYTSDGEKQGTIFSSDCKGGFFADQFENLANFRAHYECTGPEIFEQTGGKLDAFIGAAGTGGTVAGVSRFLKEKNANVRCFLIDPPGSGLFNKVTRGVMYTKEEAEGRRLKNPFDTVTEGIGINRLTENFKLAELDGAFRGTDMEAVEMSRYLLKNDGLFLGSSSAMNCVGAVRVAQAIGPGHTIVTILCDSGMRHLSKFYNAAYLSEHGLMPSAVGLEFLGLV